jgi:hypothetical protein
MNTDVLREPRGAMRVLEWLFAIIAFAACANFSTTMKYDVKCNPKSDHAKNLTLHLNHTAR